ncbi:MlaD family protein [uncultured Bilophila sp.]|uniref:MlaD family protein n=2 Tax=uncultured Bilophila sp. TaxID=529385 RepID=UPI0025FEAD10|nr:MlaD family protein [uncultured Bilophila sp.]
MSKSANKPLIGAFVVGAVTLLLIAIAVFGSGKLFQTTSRYVLFFDGSINGLSVGSPVMFRGVPVGRVTEIQLTGNLDNLVFQTPVFIELDKKKSEESFIGLDDDSSARDYLNKLVAHGLRATLATQSLLTGQLMIEMDFYPKSQLPYIIDHVKEYEGLAEIPTIPSKLENIWQKITNLPVERISGNILEITENISKFLNTADADQLIDNVNKLVVQLQQVGESIDKTLASVRDLSGPYARLARNADRQLHDTLSEGVRVLRSLDAVAKQAEETVASARGVVSRNSVTVIELNEALREVAEAARAVRVLANTLERNPESLLLGKER